MVRRGIIEAVGPTKDVTVPFDAEMIDGKGWSSIPDSSTCTRRSASAPARSGRRPGRGRPVDLAESPAGLDAGRQPQGLDPGVRRRRCARTDRSPGRAAAAAGIHRLASAPAGAIATGQSASGQPERPAAPRGRSSPRPWRCTFTWRPPPSRPPAAQRPARPCQAPGRSGPIADRRRGQDQGPAKTPIPRVLMGSVAHFRQAMLDADHHQKLDDLLRSTTAVSQPPFDPALKALLAGRGTKTLPVWWKATPATRSTGRSTSPTEFGTTAVIVGGREAAKVVDRLKAAKSRSCSGSISPRSPGFPPSKNTARRPPPERDEPLSVLAHRKTKWKEQVATAAALAKAGVPFAFATEGSSGSTAFPRISASSSRPG